MLIAAVYIRRLSSFSCIPSAGLPDGFSWVSGSATLRRFVCGEQLDFTESGGGLAKGRLYGNISLLFEITPRTHRTAPAAKGVH